MLHTPTSQPLFIRHKSAAELLEKQAAAVARMPDDDKRWPAQVLSEMHKQLPFLSKFDVDIELTRVEPEAGYALGYAMLRNKTGKQRAAEELGKATNKIRVPVIVADRLLQPFHVFEVGGKTYPLTQERVESAMMNPSMFDGISDPPGTQSLLDQIYPPFQHRQGYGMMSGDRATVGLSKLSSAPNKLAGLTSPPAGVSREDWMAGAIDTPVDRGLRAKGHWRIANALSGRGLLSNTQGGVTQNALGRPTKTASGEPGPLREFLRRAEIEKRASIGPGGVVGGGAVAEAKAGVQAVRRVFKSSPSRVSASPIRASRAAARVQTLPAAPPVTSTIPSSIPQGGGQPVNISGAPAPAPAPHNTTGSAGPAAAAGGAPVAAPPASTTPVVASPSPTAAASTAPAAAPARMSREEMLAHDFHMTSQGMRGVSPEQYKQYEAAAAEASKRTGKQISAADIHAHLSPARPVSAAPKAPSRAEMLAHDSLVQHHELHPGTSPEDLKHLQDAQKIIKKETGKDVSLGQIQRREVAGAPDVRAAETAAQSPMDAHYARADEYANLAPEAVRGIAAKAGINNDWLANYARQQNATPGQALHMLEGQFLQAQSVNPNMQFPDFVAAQQARGGLFGNKYSPTGAAATGGSFLGSAPGGLTMLGLGALGGGMMMANKASENY